MIDHYSLIQRIQRLKCALRANLEERLTIQALLRECESEMEMFKQYERRRKFGVIDGDKEG